MSLRLQLLAFGLSTLVLPWAGLRFVEQMEAALRTGLEASLIASAGTVATAFANSDELDSQRVSGGSTAAETVYAHRLLAAANVNGFVSDWNYALRVGIATPAAIALDDAHRVWAAFNGRFAYLFIEVQDADLVYQSTPGASPIGDRIVLLLGDPASDEHQVVLLATAAPGVFRAQRGEIGRFAPVGGYEERILAAWQETSDGYAVEARMPLEMLDRGLGIAVVDVDPAPDQFAVRLIASWDGTRPEAGRFIYERADVGALLAGFRRSGDRYRVLDPDGWVLADTGSIVALPAADGDTGSLSDLFFRRVLRRSDPLYDGLEQPPGRLGETSLRTALARGSATAWFRQEPAGSAIVAAAVAIDHDALGAVLLEQASDSVLTLTNQALAGLMLFTVLVSIVAAAGLLGYATVLSLRVRRLARAADTALGPKGEITVALPGNRAKDEIGDLSRSFESLLAQLAEYTSYLQSLTGKLTHELRTPLAIVSTSADNLEHELVDESSREYLDRLRQGTHRLEAILAAMSAATRVEQAVSEAAHETFDLAAVVESCVAAYRDVHRERRFVSSLPSDPCEITGSSELMAQLLDKLVDNAVGFSEPGSEIEVSLVPSDGALELSVSNRGPRLPASMRNQLFDSLVSVRDRGSEGVHLGLGLYIVALIAKYHGGTVSAEDRPAGDGVTIRVRLRRRSAG